MEDVGGNLGGIIGDLMSKGQQPRVVYDNFDFRITPGQLTKDHQNTDNHWISQFITFDRIDTSGLDNSKPIGDLSEFDIFCYLMNDNERAKLRSDYTILATRVLVKFIPWLEPLKECLGHIKHKHSTEMARKSVVIGLPVVPFNQNKHADVIKYLEWLQPIIPTKMALMNKTTLRNISFSYLLEELSWAERESLEQRSSGKGATSHLRDSITCVKWLSTGTPSKHFLV